jgi:G3E family GTPase
MSSAASQCFVVPRSSGAWREPGQPLGLGASLYLRVEVAFGRGESLATALRDVVEPRGDLVDRDAAWNTLVPMLAALRSLANRWYAQLQAVEPATPATRPAAPHARTRGPADLYIVTGALGSGKTTLVNALLDTGALTDTLVIVNELGAIPLDHMILSHAAEGVLAIGNGCLCCVVGDAVADGLRDVLAARDAGRLPPFSRIVVETSGAADPVALVERLLHDRALRRMVAYRGTIATVDALAFACGGNDLPGEVPRQLHLAQRIVVTKADRADPETLPETLDRVRALAPWARVLRPRCGPDAACELAGWFTTPDTPMASTSAPPPVAHEAAAAVISLESGPVALPGFRLFVDLLQLAKGDELYRMKGEVECAHAGERFLLQGVRSSVRVLPPLARARPGTRLTLIGRRLDSHGVRRLFDALAAWPPSRHGDIRADTLVHH